MLYFSSIRTESCKFVFVPLVLLFGNVVYATYYVLDKYLAISFAECYLTMFMIIKWKVFKFFPLYSAKIPKLYQFHHSNCLFMCRHSFLIPSGSKLWVWISNNSLPSSRLHRLSCFFIVLIFGVMYLGHRKRPKSFALQAPLFKLFLWIPCLIFQFRKISLHYVHFYNSASLDSGTRFILFLRWKL